MDILTVDEMRATDRATIESGIPSLTLMENAGHAVARFVTHELPEIDCILVVCGKGNNGGDGFVAARVLAEITYDVTVLLLGRAADVTGDARAMLDQLSCDLREAPDEAALATDEVRKLFSGADLIVDAVLGTGFKPPLGALAAAAGRLLDTVPRTPVLSVDLPSGWDADSRRFIEENAYRSDAVVTFTAPKLAHVSGNLTRGGALTRPGNLKQGPIIVAEIGSPPETIKSQIGLSWAGDSKRISETPRNPDGNKGQFGHVLVATGARGRAGAAAMASYAALRTGAGLVTAAVPTSILETVALTTPELMTLPLIEGPNGCISTRNLDAENYQSLLDKKTVIAIGPGLGQEAEAQQFALRLIEQTDLPMVLDADCLNAIAEHGFALDGGKRTLVLTPHPGEMARLVGKTVKEVQADREAIACAYALEHHVTLVLKGWRTIIAHPDGRVAINTTGNPGMAKGGSGDVLTGIVAAMLAQYKEDVAAAVEAAVYLHGLAADFAVREQNEHTLLATDTVSHLFEAFRFQPRDRAGYVWLQGLPGDLVAGSPR
jgi:ADP-dependent NAD(P)H-hydrate dehydratase / NAD(P)H-hydrate epimerase